MTSHVFEPENTVNESGSGMKAILVMNPFFFRQKQTTIATAAELGDEVVSGDTLYDVATKKPYTIDSRGYPPSRSDATKERLHWSREVAVNINANGDDADGRLLVDEGLSQSEWSLLTCRLDNKSGRLPIGIPIVGRSIINEQENPSIMILQGNVAYIATPNRSTEKDEMAVVTFICNDLTGTPIRADFRTIKNDVLPLIGRMLSWNEDDVKCVEV